MPNTLPIPSKGALRTLRNLALGTSCTVAFSAGLLTEDRRRRINAARVVHNNAKKLKLSRKYHSAGNAVVETFEEQVVRCRDDGFWQAREASRIIEPPETIASSDLQSSKPPARSLNPSPPLSIRRYGLLPQKNLRPGWRPPSKPQPPELPSGPSLPIPPEPQEPSKPERQNRQLKLAYDVIKLLEDKEDPANIDAAALRFFEAFEEGLPIDSSGIVAELIDAAVQLSRACQTLGKYESREKLLDIVLEHGPIDEDIFFRLHAGPIIRNLMSGPLNTTTGHTEKEEGKLRKAASLYLTKFKETPGIMSDRMLSLGGDLCAVTCRQRMFDLTETLYWRVDRCRGSTPNNNVHHLITAAFEQGKHAKVIKFFRRFYTNTSPDQLQFYNVGGMVIDSLCATLRLDIAEETLIALAKMAQERRILASTTWFLNVLRYDWRTHRDIARTRALFERLEPLLQVVSHPQAAYPAMVQFCVEAGDEAAARSYHERLKKRSQPTIADIRIYRHFAYAKAMHKDWTGVKEEFRKLQQLDPDRSEYSAAFTPILTLFASSHSVNETEEFLRTFIEQYDVVLTPYMSTTMIDKYAESREIDSISRWLDYMVSVGSPIDPMFFNAVLNHCYEKWKFTFHEISRLYQTVQAMESSAARFVNEHTSSILRRVATADSHRDIPDAGIIGKKLSHAKLDYCGTFSLHSRGIQEAMASALASGSPSRALNIFKKAQHQQVSLHGPVIALAVKASLQLDPENIDAMTSLIRSSQSIGYDVSGALTMLFVNRISEMENVPSTNYSCYTDLAWSTISVLDQHDIPVPVRIVTHTVHTLVQHGRHRQAIAFWDSVSRRQAVPMAPDLATLTTLLQAYIILKDHVGVDWVIQMLPVNDLVPDNRFKSLLKDARRQTKKILIGVECANRANDFLAVVNNALEVVKTLRRRAIQEKENIRIKTIKIMEKAIEVQRAGDDSLAAIVEKASKDVLGEMNNISSTSSSDWSQEAWIVSDEELDYMPQKCGSGPM